MYDEYNMQLSLAVFDCFLCTLLFTHQSTGTEPGLWNINTKMEGSEFRGLALKLHANVVLKKTEAQLLRLDEGRDDIKTEHTQVLFHPLF